MLPSELFYQFAKSSYLYNIMPIANIPSVLQHGLLSNHRIRALPHSSIAMQEVQNRREQITVTDGLNLHDYANLYFHYWNPMLYKRKSENDRICLLCFSSTVLDMEGCVVSDRNAASSMVRFYAPEVGIPQLKFDKIYDRFWTHPDPYEQNEHKKIKCAEVLVPHCIPIDFLNSACVVNETNKQRLRDLGFTKPIYVKSSEFFD